MIVRLNATRSSGTVHSAVFYEANAESTLIDYTDAEMEQWKLLLLYYDNAYCCYYLLLIALLELDDNLSTRHIKLFYLPVFSKSSLGQ